MMVRTLVRVSSDCWIEEKRKVRVSVPSKSAFEGKFSGEWTRVLSRGTDSDGKPDDARVGCVRPARVRLDRAFDMDDSPRRR